MVNKRTASWESKCSPQDSFSWLIKRIGRIYSARLSWSISRIWWNQFGWCRESFCCVIEKNWESSSDKIKRDTHACSDSVASRGYKWRFTVLSGHLYSFVPLWNLKMSLSILYLTNNTGVPKPEILRPKIGNEIKTDQTKLVYSAWRKNMALNVCVYVPNRSSPLDLVHWPNIWWTVSSRCHEPISVQSTKSANEGKNK